MLDNYTVSLYIRLSAEDENEGESNSIKNQRDLLMAFIAKHPELSSCNIVEFCDDGHSGVNFDRPSVKKMLEKVRNGEIHCIIVKDFSRFGRSYIEVGDYLEQVFPFLGVRFISINDNYDSASPNSALGDMEVALRTLIYDLYSKDLSQKVKSGITAKKRRGEFAGSNAIYGYAKSLANKRNLVIDNEAAAIIRQIFEFAISGKKAKDIAYILNAQNIPTRSEYRALKGNGRNWGKTSKIGSFWRADDIRKIIADIRYTGASVGNMHEQKSIGSKAYRLTPKETWIIVPGTHPAIISEEEYSNAQKILGHVPRPKSVSEERILFNKVRCHNCNLAMRRRRGKNSLFRCDTPNSIHSPECVKESIPEFLVEEALLSAIQAQAEVFAKAEKTRQNRQKTLERKLNETRQSMRQFESNIKKIEVTKQEHYECYKDEKISKDEYLFQRESCNRQIDELAENVAELTERLMNTSATLAENSAVNNEWRDCAGIAKLSREIVDVLVESIIVYDHERIEIRFKYADGFSG